MGNRNPSLALGAGLLRAAEFGDATVGFGVAARIDFVRLYFFVKLKRLGAIIELLVLYAGGAHAGVVRRLRVPLVAAVVVFDRAVLHLVRLALVDIAEHEGDVGDLVALG